MFHKTFPLRKVVALSLAVAVMIPVASNWQEMFGSVHKTIHSTLTELIGQ